MRTILLSTLAAVLLILSPTSVAEEEAPTSAADPGLEAMAELAPMVGHWQGSGWTRRGPGEPQHTLSLETVEFRLGGRILVVEGLHHAEDEPSRVVHHAFGVISYDSESGGYRFQTHLATGRSSDYEMRREGEDILWFMDTPRGQIRYTIRLQDGGWHETGEFSADGETWQEFFGMDLQRIDP